MNTVRHKCYSTLDQVGVKLGREFDPGMSAVFVLLSREDRIDKVLPGEEPMMSENVKNIKDRKGVIDRGGGSDRGYHNLRGVSRGWEGISLHPRR